MGGLNAQDLANVLQALANLKASPGPGLLAALLGAVLTRLPAMTPAGMAAVAYSLARLGHKPDPAWGEAFLGRMEGALFRAVGCLLTSATAGAARSAAARRRSPPSLTSASRAPSRPTKPAGMLQVYQPGALALAAWAVAECGLRPPPRWLAELSRVAEGWGPELSPQGRTSVDGLLRRGGLAPLPPVDASGSDGRAVAGAAG
jgi:hypothetical protein